uniref:Adenylate kinase isoenzyme 6 homolog n=1 Tax=Chrysotila carterae TaxID=13221 RepID=A0A7S4B7M9_CHRCT|mmetsp:Transcript_40689/g.89313  ORF Transcript_40689/g.89313 Transcript_40689/m.89313 type:complete len:178 (-) Transcript_40689:104-637(-)
MFMAVERLPNILLTGTPGTGKSATAAALVARVPQLKHIEVGTLVREKQLHQGWDEEFECHILDEERMCDELEDAMEAGGVILDFHGADLFPERWFDLVAVLRADNTILYGRLESRGYSEKKLAENVEAEIMQVILDEARGAYPEEAVVELASNTVEDLDSNVSRIVQWIENWISTHQ